MPRLKIGLDDSWTESRLTQIGTGKESVYGCGISLDVWQHLFDFHDGSWFATITGGYYDNLDLFSVEDLPSAVVPFVIPDGALEWGNLSPMIGNFPFHALSNDIQRKFGVSDSDKLSVGGPIRAALHLHDDFIFQISRTAPGLIDEAVRFVIRVHEHYLGIDLPDQEETDVSDKVADIARRERDIELRSEPAERRLTISYRRPRTDWLSRLLHRTERHEEVISFK